MSKTYKRRLKFMLRCLLRFFNEPVQQNHMFLINREEDPSNTAIQFCADFPQIFLNFPDERHSQWPPKLSRLNVLANLPFILSCKLLEPLSHRLIFGLASVKDNGKYVREINHVILLYHNWYACQRKNFHRVFGSIGNVSGELPDPQFAGRRFRLVSSQCPHSPLTIPRCPVTVPP